MFSEINLSLHRLIFQMTGAVYHQNAPFAICEMRQPLDMHSLVMMYL